MSGLLRDGMIIVFTPNLFILLNKDLQSKLPGNKPEPYTELPSLHPLQIKKWQAGSFITPTIPQKEQNTHISLS